MATLLQRGSPATLIGYPPGIIGAAPATSVDIYLPAGELLAQTATTETSALTVTDAPEGSSNIVVEVAQVWRTRWQYIITGGGGAAIIDPVAVECRHGVLDVTLQTKQPLPTRIPVGCFVGFRGATFDLSSTYTAQAGEGVAVWTCSYSAGGRVIKWSERLRVVERLSGYALNAHRLTVLSPYSAARRPDTDRAYDEVIDAAWARYLAPALAIRGIMPEQINTWSVIEPAHVAAVEMLLAQTYDQDPQMREEKRAAFAEAMRQALDNQGIWIQPSTDTGVTPPAVQAQGWRTTMVTR